MPDATVAVKRGNLARRERLNPDWPIVIYKWDCWPMNAAGKPCAMPEALWQAAHLMRELWNELCAVFDRAVILDAKDNEGKPALDKQARAAVYFPFGQRKTIRTEKNEERYDRAAAIWGDVPTLHDIGCAYRGRLPSACYEFVVSRFLLTVKAWQKNPKRNGAPKVRHRLDKIRIPLVFNDGRPLAWLSDAGDSAPVQARNTLSLKPSPGESPSLDYLLNGWFDVGVDRERIGLHVALHRDLPNKGRIKCVSLVGSFDKAFKWAWSLQVQLEHPKPDALLSAGRVAGLDLGWRVMEDAIRIGVLADSDGNSIELRIPFSFANRDNRSERHWGTDDYSKITDWRKLSAAQSRIDEKKDECKAALDALTEDWPADARAVWQGKHKLSFGGLFKLRRLLIDESESTRVLDQWAEGYQIDRARLRAAEVRAKRTLDDAQRKLARWLAVGYDVIAWEGDLDLKEMAEAETAEYALKESQKWRQRTSPHTLRLYIRQAMTKAGRDLRDEQTAGSTRTCSFCGGDVEPTSKLLSVCENGHQTDQDERASINYLNLIESPASTSGKPLEIPAELSRCLRALAEGKEGVKVIGGQ